MGNTTSRGQRAAPETRGAHLRSAGRVIVGLAVPSAIWASVLFIFAASPPAPATASPEKTVSLTGLPTKTRTVALALTSTSVDIRAEARYDRDDPRAEAVVRDQVSTGTWFYGTFGQVTLDVAGIQYLIADAELHWTVTADSVLVKASKSLSQPLITSLDVGLSKDFPSLTTDQVSLHIGDYTVRSMAPEPMTYSNGMAVWYGGQASDIKVGLQYTGPGKVLDILRRQPQLGAVWDTLLLLPGAISGMIPIIVALWLAVRLHGTEATDDSPNRAMRLLPLWLGASLAYYISFAADSLVAMAFEVTPPPEVLVWWRILAAGLIGLAGAVIAFAVLLTKLDPVVKRISVLVARGLIIGGLLVALFDAAVWYVPQHVPNDQWQLLSFAIGFALLAGLGGYTAHELNRMAKLKHLVWRRTLFLIALAGIVLLTPWSSRLVGDQTYPTWVLASVTLPSVLPSVFTIGRVATLLVLIYLLHREFSQSALGEKWVIVFVFAAFAVGMYPLVIWGMLPLSFLLAVVFARLLLLQPHERMKKMAGVRDEVVKNRARWLKAALNAVQAEDLRVASVSALQKKAKSGDLTTAEYRARLDDLDEYVETQKMKEAIGDFHAHEVVLVFGPRDKSFDNGILGLLLAGAFAIPLVALQFALLGFPYADQLQYPILYVVIAIASTAIVWPASGFFFGYFLQNLKFGSGLSKGLLIGSVVAVMKLPELFTGIQSVADVTVTVLGAVWTIVFFAVLGLVFDYLTWRRAYGRRDAFRSMSSFAGLQPAVAALSLALPSIGVALLTAATGQFGQVVSLLLKLVPPPANASP